MYFTTHLITGAAVGSLMPGPGTAALLGATSHAVADMIPHHDYSTVAAGLVDLGVGLTILGVGWNAGLPTVAIVGAVAGAIPDLEVALKHLGLWPWPLLFPSHSGLLPHGRTSFWPGLGAQAALAAASLFILWGRAGW